MTGVGDEAPLVLERCVELREHVVQGDRETRDFVAGGRDGKQARGRRRDARRAPAHRLDRAQSSGRQRVSGKRCEQNDERADDEQLPEDPVQRLIPGCQRARDHDRAAGGHRLGQDPPLSSWLVEEHRPEEPGTVRAPRGVATIEQRRQSRLRRLDRTAGGIHHLGKSHAARGVRIDEPMLVVGVSDCLTRLRPKCLVDGSHQCAADAHIHKNSHCSDHADHCCGERSRQPQADRNRTHSATLNR